MSLSIPSRLSILALCIASLAGCASSQPPHRAMYSQEAFNSKDVYARSFPGSTPAACEAARRALLSQGYLIRNAGPTEVAGRKKFQLQSDVHMEVDFQVVCAPDSKGSNSTSVFANAVRDRYTLKKSNNSASLGVGVLGSVSVPISLSDESLVKVGSETIAAREYYDGFFALVERYIDVPADLTEPSPPTPVPAPIAVMPPIPAPANVPAAAPVISPVPNLPAAAPVVSAAPNVPTAAPVVSAAPNAPLAAPVVSAAPNAPAAAAEISPLLAAPAVSATTAPPADPAPSPAATPITAQPAVTAPPKPPATEPAPAATTSG